MLKRLVPLLTILAALPVAVFCLEATAQEIPGDLPPGRWAEVPPLPDDAPSYLHVPDLGDSRYLPIPGNLHAARTAALRSWLTQSGLFAHFYADPVLTEDTNRYYVQLAAAGYALEGMAAVFLIETADGAVVNAQGYGFWSETPEEGPAASMGPAGQTQITRGTWFELDHARNIIRPTIDRIAGIFRADPAALDSYRNALTRHWGPLPDTALPELLFADRVLRKTLRIDLATYEAVRDRLDGLPRTIVDLDAHFAGLDFAKPGGAGTSAFADLWHPLAELVCDLVTPVTCGNLGADDAVYPQSAIEWQIGIGSNHPTARYVETETPWKDLDDDTSRLLVGLAGDDTLVEDGHDPDGTRRVVIDFAAGRSVYLDGRLEYVSRFVGPLNQDGLAEGDGTLYFTGPRAVADWDRPGRRSVLGTFKAGRLDGTATFYFADGLPECTGTWKASLRDGEVRCNRPRGLPGTRATFAAGKPSDGPFTTVELNPWTLLPYRIFDGRISAGKREGEWQFILFQQDQPDGSRLLTRGETAIYRFADGAILTGQYDHRLGAFMGPCVARFESGTLETTCNGRTNPEFPFDGPGRFTPAATNMPQDTQDVVVTNGAWDFYTLTRVRTKKAGALRRLGRELERWGKDIEGFARGVRDDFCEFMDSLAPEDQECNINIVGHVGSDGTFTIGETPGDRPGTGPVSDGVISDEAIAWMRSTEIQDLARIPVWFEEKPYFNFGKLSEGGPIDLPLPFFESGHVRPPTLSGWPRAAKKGEPQFGARRSRSGGQFVYHTGIDYATKAGDPVVSPVNGTVLRVVKNPDGLDTIVVQSDTVAVRILYVKDAVPKGTVVRQGDRIASAGSLSARSKYAGVPNHVHMTIMDRNEIGYTYNLTGNRRIPINWPYPLELFGDPTLFP